MSQVDLAEERVALFALAGYPVRAANRVATQP